MYRWVGPGERARIAARLLAGERTLVLGREFGCSPTTIYRIGQEAVQARRRVVFSPHRLSFEEREEIFAGIQAGLSDAEIARRLGRHRSTVGREIARSRCGDRRRYRPLSAQRRSRERCARPKERKLARCPRLLAEVERGLGQGWSPEQISARLRCDHPDDQEMRISHETIYLSLFVQSRGELRKQLSAQLRTGRRRRQPQGRGEKRGRIVDMVSISERPAEVGDRAVPGHWEGDLIVGAGGQSAVATLVERHTRYVLLGHLGRDRSTDHVIGAIKDRIGTLPEHLARSLTWDQGKELAAHQRFTVDTGVKVYFCDPHSPWQRGSNENTNGLLRQYLPKGTDLAEHRQEDLDRIAAQLNGRPRKTLDWMTPAEKMAELLAA
ncbi:MAG: IS30 family transposase [Solirubrobacteraceae bacterium]